MTDDAGGDGDQPVVQGGDHGLAAADAVSDQSPVPLGGGEVVQPTAERGGEQPAPHPCPVDRDMSLGYPQVNRAWMWGALLAVSIAGWTHQLTATPGPAGSWPVTASATAKP